MIGREFVSGWGLGLLLLGIVVGCGSEKKIREGIPPLYPSEDFSINTYWIGSLGVVDQEVVGAGADHRTMLMAKFGDFTEVQVFVAERDLYQPSCFLYTSERTQIGQPKTLNVNSVIVKGLKDGDHTINANGDSSFLADRAFTGSQVSFEVESNDGDSDFPSFSDQIKAPAFPKLLRLGDLKSLDLSTAPSLGITTSRADSLIVEWQASNADYFEFVITPRIGAEIEIGKLRCIAYDDGYLEVPTDAIQNLASDQYTDFQVSIERHNFKLHMIPNADTPKAAALIDVSSVLQAIVLR